MRCVLGVLAVAVATLGAPAWAAPADAIRAGDMQAMIPEIIAVYENEGLSWDHGIEWKTGPFTTTFWYYDPNLDEIIAGAVPTDAQIGEYWQTWSTVLTDGNFDPDGFFASDTEAGEMARYNQYVLATHESAHAITFRYDYPHLARHEYDINCREYYADRLTVAILNEQARLDSDMARWRDRYRELVIAMGDTIPDQYRYHIPDFAALDADCGLIEVAQPTPDAMQPYASAYFERYRVLLEADLPPMAEVFDAHLRAPWDAAHANIPYAPQRDGIEVVTLSELPEVTLGTVYGKDSSIESDDRTRVAAFDASGTLWFASLGYDRQTRLASLAFGTDPDDTEPLLPPAEWHLASVRLELSSLAVISADRFIVSLQHWDKGGEDGAERYFVSFILADRTDDGWTLTSIAEVDGMAQGVILRSPSGKLFMIATPDHTGRNPTTSWIGFEISLQRADVVGELPINSGFDFPLAADDEGRLYEELSFMLWGSTPEGNDAVVIGNGHMGPRDGVGAKAELSDLLVFQWMEGGRALFIDRGPGWDGWRLRELRPLQ